MDDRARRDRTIGIVTLAVMVSLGVLFVLSATISLGVGGAVLFVGLTALVIGLGAVIFGRRWWALITSRKTGAGLLAGGVALVIVGGLILPPAAASNSAQTLPPRASATTSSSSSSAPLTTESGSSELTDAEVNALIATAQPQTALAALGVLVVRAAVPVPGYDRGQFGPLWADVNGNGCDTRNEILARDLTNQQVQPDCVVLSGQLMDPFTATTVSYTWSATSNGTVDVDSFVTPADAWVKGAQGWDAATRQNFANDPFDLLAVGAQTGGLERKSDAAGWMPANVDFHCEYVARQVAVKTKYALSVTPRERAVTAGVLRTCPSQAVPTDTAAIKAAADQQAVDAAAAVAAQAAADQQAVDAAAAVAAQAAADQQAADAAVAAAAQQAAQAAADASAAASRSAAQQPPAPAPSSGTVTPGAFCSSVGAVGVTNKGTPMVCSLKAGDPRARWRSAG